MFKSPLNHALTAVVATIAFGAAAAPAMASEKEPQTVLYPQEKNGETVYCAKEFTRTSAFLPAKICKDRSGWAKEGLNIPADTRAAESPKQKSAQS